MNINLNWPKRAVIILAFSLVFLTAALAIFAIRDAERERLLSKRAVEEEQRRCADAISGQVEDAVAATEERVGKLLQRYRESFNEGRFAQTANEIVENEKLVLATFLVDGTGQITFAGAKPLYILPGEARRSRELSGEIWNSELQWRAENAELQKHDYPEAIAVYQQLMARTSDQGSKAFLLARMGRCHVKSRSFQRAIETYRKVLEICPPHVTAEDIPLGVIAWLQIGNAYLKDGNKEKATEAFLELRRDLLDSKWPLDESQFGFYTSDAEERILSLVKEMDAAGRGNDIRDKWKELNRLETERLKFTRILKNVSARAIPRLDAKHSDSKNRFGMFSHISESSDDALSLVSYVRLAGQITFGMILNPDVLAQTLVPEDSRKIRIREGWYLQVADESGAIVAGQDVSSIQPLPPQLTFTGTFAGAFPPWKINIYQSDLDAPQRQYRMRMSLYIFSVFTVIAALFIGGYMAIRSTAKELKLAALKSDFVATVSHEFRTPLMSIRYLSELLQRGRVPDDRKKQQYYETITNESERLARLVENILDFSKIETGMKRYRLEEADIAALAADVAARFRQQAGLKNFTLETEMANDLPGIAVDKEAVSRALFNLLDNAVKYSEKNPRVVLRVWRDGNHVFLEVADDGIGISPGEQQKVFQKFYRSDRALAGNVKGSGIGLTLVDHIVRAHGGKVLLESEPGRGTKVRIQLPQTLAARDEDSKNG